MHFAAASFQTMVPRRCDEVKRNLFGYRAELRQRPELLRLLHEVRRRGPLTLLHGMRDAPRNHAIVVRELLEKDKDNEP